MHLGLWLISVSSLQNVFILLSVIKSFTNCELLLVFLIEPKKSSLYQSIVKKQKKKCLLCCQSVYFSQRAKYYANKMQMLNMAENSIFEWETKVNNIGKRRCVIFSRQPLATSRLIENSINVAKILVNKLQLSYLKTEELLKVAVVYYLSKT